MAAVRGAGADRQSDSYNAARSDPPPPYSTGQTVMPYIPVCDESSSSDLASLQSMIASIASQQQLMQLQLNQFVMMQEQHNKRTAVCYLPTPPPLHPPSCARR
eukprot:TRINITY_DN9987_c0_g1_i2.p2 TRINITY_DN9987_c0_g1~~TRINITY_DN9987_c0_g1_i2.p2  ORF type:complete len:103 (+),score=27.28 TRINITY_DN9987_c0_g1_i2:104-412(+)